MKDLLELIEEIFNPLLVPLKKRYPENSYIRFGLIFSKRMAGRQGTVHYDFPASMRNRIPGLQAVSCLIAVDGFGFTYLGANGKWQELWVPEGTWVSFTNHCLHFGSANPFTRRAIRIFIYAVSNPADFPDKKVYTPEPNECPNPDKGIYPCYSDQSQVFVP